MYFNHNFLFKIIFFKDFYESIMYNYTLSEINLDKNLFTSKTESILLESMRKSFCSAIISIKLRFSIFKNEIDSELNFHK